ncbi:hypothetical protein [Streptosporangium sp. 'caverna']|uniref:hypothetical protein n=1 Tax=Streptosporangium sp. 'caverna' TaxID=2202249 RepID=UPI000D7D95A9|nr:hypothetical protein [Streptosporangium sp. 'caverna']AWS45921.1 hypothetical protein DKM19_36120 [Streptosporangium sp. 'caverna']
MRQPDEGELRARSLANEAQVRSWIADWNCPEIVWAEFPEEPVSTAFLEQDSEWWWNTSRIPWMRNQIWPLSADPSGESRPSVRAAWRFDSDYMFQELSIHVESILDPEYLAEMLALGVHAAALKGWQEEDAHSLYRHLYDALNHRPLSNSVLIKGRLGFVLFEFMRMPFFKEVRIMLRLTLTSTATDGTPLNEHGGTPFDS